MKTALLLLLALGVHPSLPVPALAAQTTNPPYLREFPTVERVLREVRGATPDETAARQMGTFLQFKSIIEKMKGYRKEQTADEKRLIQVYFTAYWEIAKTKPEYQRFTGLKGFDIDPDYRVELFQKFFPASVRVKYEEVDATFKRSIAARAQADTQEMLRVRAEIAEAGQKSTKLAEEQAQIRRCVESGRSEAQCMMEGLGKSFKDQFKVGALLDLLPIPKAPPSGLRMGGAFPGAGSAGVGLTFYPEHVLLGCQDLVRDPYAYTVAVKDGQALITLQNSPKPLALSVRPDGRLMGPGAVDIAGRVQVGTEWGTRTWGDGRTEPISRPVYQPRTRRCNAGLLTTSGPSPALGALSSAPGAVLSVLLGGADEKAGKPAPPGLRLTGEYGTQAGFDLDFRSEGVVVGCREVTILRDYTVAAAGNQVTVAVQHGTAPFAMTLAADGRLTGSGTVRVDGRQVSGTGPNGEITYVPRTASCAVGILSPARGGSSSASPASSAPPAPAVPASGDAVLAVTAAAPNPAGGTTPVAGKTFLLLNAELTGILTAGGFQPTQGRSLLRTLAHCQNTDPNCQKGSKALLGHVVGVATSDPSGKAGFAGVAAGTYYLMAAAESGGQPILWNLKVELKPGQNALLLTPRNLTPIP